MANTLNDKDFGLKIYNKFPPKYREDDVSQNYALKRYLEALADGGFSPTIKDINGITTLIDAERVNSKVLPILLRQFGFEAFNGIPENYLRYLLPKLGEAWSKKGSLDVVEFITSSLSGIKTSTTVTYDENDNPLIDVRLEMDYNIGEYFPDVEQFTRLLKNFTPFYCDINLIYSYLFYETQILRSKDDLDIMTIIDHREEKGLIPYMKGERDYPLLNDEDKVLNDSIILNEPFKWDIDPDYHEDLITMHIKESVGLTRVRSKDYLKKSLNTKALNSTLILNEYMETDELLDKVKYPLISEQAPLKGVDMIEDTISTTVIGESASILKRGVQITDATAVLGEAVLGVSILGYDEENADLLEDHVTHLVKENGELEQLLGVTSYTNTTGHVLNSSFHLNSGFHSYDVITKNGEKTYIVY